MTLTPLQFKALYAIYQDGLRERMRFVAPRDGLSRPCPALVRRGLLEVVETRRVYGRYRKAKTYRAYRVTDAGRALLPAPSVPLGPLAPQRSVVLTVETVRDVRATIANGWKDVCVWSHPDGVHLTAFFRLEPLPYGRPSAYSPETFAADMSIFIRRLLPRAAVTATAVFPARRFPGDELRAAELKSGSLAGTETIQMIRNARLVAWVAVTFHFQEDIPLLCAGNVAPGDTGSALLTIAPATEDDDLPPVSIDQFAVWTGLTVEAQAALVLLSGRPGWQPVLGVAESDLRALDHDLLIFWQRQLQEARITARGLDLVGVMVSVESVA